MDDNFSFDVCVIGAGPGGYPAAIRAAQRGARVALVEKMWLGGVCLNEGCVPTKTLIANAEALNRMRHAEEFGISVSGISFDYEKMAARKDRIVVKLRKSLEALIMSNKITLFHGRAELLSPNTVLVHAKEPIQLSAKSIILATGSSPMPLKCAPYDGNTIIDSTSILSLTILPKSLAIIGGGVIGCEFASLYHELGVKITLIEMLPNLLPREAQNVSTELRKSFERRGITVRTDTTVEKVTTDKKGATIFLSGGETIQSETVLVAVGRQPNTEGLSLSKAGLTTDSKGAIPVNDKMETAVPGIYAIGDLTGRWWLAHVASHEGLVAGTNATGGDARMHYEAVPSVIFTKPEIGTVGMTLAQATKAGIDATLGAFPFQALGKAQAAFETEGFAQIVLRKDTGQILGAQVVGYEAATLIAEMGVAIANELTIDCITDTIHAHPTIAEIWLEAALQANDEPLHLPPRRTK